MRTRSIVSAALVLAAASIAQSRPAGPRRPPAPPAPSTELPEARAIDGAGNHGANPGWGVPGSILIRRGDAAYADGAGEPSGADRPGAREISNAVLAQEGSVPSADGVSDFVWQWGQFLDHDITLTPVLDPPESFDIAVPLGDVHFDPFDTGTQVIPLDRSYYEVVGGVREQVNDITAFVDASNVYGSDDERARALRTLDGTGRMKTSDGGLLPFNTAGLPNAPTAHDASYFLAGDFRANEQVALTSLHTLFVREHNHWADRIRRSKQTDMRKLGRALKRRGRSTRATRARGEALSGDEIYELARAMVGAEMQVITYRDFLPVLLGRGALAPYRGYRDDVNPGITNEFATAAYRVGHTMLSPTLLRLDRRGRTISAGDLSLSQAFFTPTELIDNGGIEPILRGLASQVAQEVDVHLVDDVRNLLFGPPGSGGLDLAALNIQRGRDHGLPAYNRMREDYGLDAATSFDDITSDADLAADLAEVYGSVDLVDAWVGGLAEDHVGGGLVGETFRKILADQFQALRDGDRFWYQHHLPPELRKLVEKQTLAKIIRRNTRIGRELQRDVFHVRD